MTDSISRIDFNDSEYTVKQNLVRNKYTVSDSSGNVVLKAKQKMFRMKEEFPFTDPEGNVIFRIKAKKMLDIAGDYAIIDEESGDTVAILEKKFTLLKHVWRIRKPDSDEVIAKIESGSAFIELLRSISEIMSLLPHSYTIEDAESEQIGSIEGKFSLKDTYRVSINDPEQPYREAIIAAAVTIDALEGN